LFLLGYIIMFNLYVFTRVLLMNNFMFMVQNVGIAVKFVIKYLATGVF